MDLDIAASFFKLSGIVGQFFLHVLLRLLRLLQRGDLLANFQKGFRLFANGFAKRLHGGLERIDLLIEAVEGLGFRGKNCFLGRLVLLKGDRILFKLLFDRGES